MLILEKMVPTDPRLPLSLSELGEILEQLMELFGLPDLEVALRIVDDRAMAELNDRFMGCMGPTNVLSFPQGSLGEQAGDGAALADESERLGDMVLSVDTLSREIFLYNQDYREYTVRLLAHGLLHLAGYDHGPEMDDLTELAVASVGGSDPAAFILPASS